MNRCKCGHTIDWHAQGWKDCEHDGECHCEGFDLATRHCLFCGEVDIGDESAWSQLAGLWCCPAHDKEKGRLNSQQNEPPVDPVCLIHGKRWSEHDGGRCLYCCICFKALTPDECAVDSAGQKWDVCKGQCATEAGVL